MMLSLTFCHSQAPLPVIHSIMLSIQVARRVWFFYCYTISEVPQSLSIPRPRLKQYWHIKLLGSFGMCSAAALAPSAYWFRCYCRPSKCHPVSHPPISTSPLLWCCQTSLITRSWRWSSCRSKCWEGKDLGQLQRNQGGWVPFEWSLWWYRESQAASCRGQKLQSLAAYAFSVHLAWD